MTDCTDKNIPPGATAPLPGVLIVEDDSSDVFAAHRQFKKSKLRNPFHIVGTAAEMLDYLHGEAPYHNRAIYPMPAVIILDLGLPDMDGVRAQAMLRASLKFRHIPIVVISSSEKLAVLQTAVGLGANGYLVKPFDPQDFKRIAAKLRLPIEFAGD